MMSYKSKINLLKSYTGIVGIVFFILANMIGCGTEKNNRRHNNSDPIRPEATRKFGNLQPCPDSVTAKAKDGGYIELNWNAHAPDTNTRFTFTVIPYTPEGVAASVTETTDKGSRTLDGYPKGFYYVYYEIYPASSSYVPCVGIETKLIFL